MFDDVATGSWILHLTVMVDEAVDDVAVAHQLVAQGARAGYAVDVVDINVDDEGNTRIYVEVPFDTFDDEDVEMVSLSVIEDLQYYVSYDIVGDDITEREV